jgi:hypothetical protein
MRRACLRGAPRHEALPYRWLVSSGLELPTVGDRRGSSLAVTPPSTRDSRTWQRR